MPEVVPWAKRTRRKALVSVGEKSGSAAVSARGAGAGAGAEPPQASPAASASAPSRRTGDTLIGAPGGRSAQDSVVGRVRLIGAWLGGVRCRRGGPRPR